MGIESKSTIKYTSESYNDIAVDIAPLLIDHCTEVEDDRDIIKLKPDWEAYKKLYDEGHLQITAMRDKGNLIGYSIEIIQTHPHHADSLMAYNSLIYVKPEYRHRRHLVSDFIIFVQHSLKRRGVIKHTLSMRPKHMFSRLATKCGYSLMEVVHAATLR